MICGYPVDLIIYALVCHFGLSCFMGFAGYWLTLTILSRLTVGGSIHRFSLVVGLCFSVASHILQDYYLGWF